MPDRDPSSEEPLQAVHELHAEVDASAMELARVHAARLECRRGCSACCLDDLTVLGVEAQRIEREFSHVLEEAPGPAGGCAFLDEAGGCRVYAARPYICRTQGLPLAMFHEDAEGEIHEERAICELNVEGPPLESLDLDDCWVIGPVEQRLVTLQENLDGAARRVSLRGLFRNGANA